MQCNCGNEAVRREMVRDKRIVGYYYYCDKCRRIEKSKQLLDYLANQENR